MSSLSQALLRQEPLLIQPRLLIDFVARCGSFDEMLQELLGAPPKAEIIDGVGVIPVTGIILNSAVKINRRGAETQRIKKLQRNPAGFCIHPKGESFDPRPSCPSR